MTPSSPAARRYFRRAALSVAIYGFLVGVAAASAARARVYGATLDWIAALAPGAPVLAAMIATSRYLADERDAVQRAIQLEALLWAIGVTFGVATVWGFLERLLGAPPVPSYLAFAVFSSVVASVQLARRLFPKR